MGVQFDGAVHSRVRRGLERDIDPEALRHVAMLSIPTIGFPKSAAARSWITDIAE